MEYSDKFRGVGNPEMRFGAMDVKKSCTRSLDIGVPLETFNNIGDTMFFTDYILYT